MTKNLEQLMQEETRKREEYQRQARNGIRMLFLIVAALVAALVVALFANQAVADDVSAASIVLDAELESGEFMIGTVGDEPINVQKWGNQTTGTVGDEAIYLHEIKIGDWEMTTGHIGTEIINVQKFGVDDDD